MPTTKTTAKTKGLWAKLAEITGLMAEIEKGGWNKNQRYRFVRESDVAAKASELLSERGIFILQSVVSSDTTPLYETSSGTQMFLTHVRMGFQFIDSESGDKSEVVHFEGAGADMGDKGIYKAMTGAEKYFLMKTFLISTGDDPEADEKTDREAAAKGAKKGAKVKGKASTTAKKGGKSDGITGAQMKAIAELITEKGLSMQGYLAVVSMTDVKIEDGADANVVTKNLTSEQAGAVIIALQGMEESKTEQAEAVEQEGMSIV